MIQSNLSCKVCNSISSLLLPDMTVRLDMLPFVPAYRFALAAYHPQLPVVMVVMATRQRHFAFRFIDVVRAQQQALKLPGLLKIDMAGYEFFEQDFYGRQQLIHLSKSGCCALGAAMAFEVVTKMPTPSS